MKPSTNSPYQAIALSSEPCALPRVSAKGSDELADRIIAVAREHNIPIREEPELLRLLSGVPLGDEIPEILYIAVSEVLSFACSLNEEVEASEL